MARLIIPVKIDAKVFSRFAFFDTMRLNKHWRSPALFAAIMLASSLIVYSQVGQKDGAALLGTVLLAVGLALPAGYILRFSLSVRAQIKKMGLGVPKPVYTLTLEDESIHVATENGQDAGYRWDELFGVFRGRDAAYLYIAPTRAYLLPDRDLGEQRSALWQMAERHGKAR